MGFKRRASNSQRFFTEDAMQFLVDLEQENTREWFADNKARYEAVVREPALEFVRAMAASVQAVSKHFEASDKRVGGALMRIYRDTRFARDKTPYKTNIGLHFRHQGGKDVHGPGLYVHISLDSCFIGVGSWRPESSSLAAIRKRIVDHGDAWLAARDDRGFRRYFELSGESLKRMPRGFSEDAAHAIDLRRKDHLAIAELSLEDVLGDGLVEFCATRFLAAQPYVHFLMHAVKAPV